MPLAGLAAVAAPIAGPLLLAAEQWVAGARRAGRRAPARGGGGPGAARAGPPVGRLRAGRARCSTTRTRWWSRCCSRAGSIARLGPARGRRRPRAPATSPRRRSGWPWSSTLAEPVDSSPRAAPTGRCRSSRSTRLLFTPTPTGRPARRRAGRRLPVRRADARSTLRRPGLGVVRRARPVWWGGGVETAVEAAAEPTAPTPRVRRRRLAVLVVGALVAMGVVVVATDQVSQPEPEPLGPAAGAWTVVPHTGLGAWVDVYDWTVELGGPAPSVDADDVDAMAEAGVQTLYIQTAHTRSATPGVMEPERLAPIIQRAHDHRHARGGVVPAHLRGRRRRPAARSPSRPPSTSAGWPSTSSRPRSPTSPSATAACSTSRTRLRAAVGPDKAIAAITPSAVHLQVVNPSYWPAFPWSELADTYDAMLPMTYWSIRTGDLRDGETYTADNLDRIRASVGDSDIPIVPVGGLAEDSTVDDLEGMVAAIDARGSPGGGLYDWATSTPEQWAVLAPLRDLQLPVPGPDPDG